MEFFCSGLRIPGFGFMVCSSIPEIVTTIMLDSETSPKVPFGTGGLVQNDVIEEIFPHKDYPLSSFLYPLFFHLKLFSPKLIRIPTSRFVDFPRNSQIFSLIAADFLEQDLLFNLRLSAGVSWGIVVRSLLFVVCDLGFHGL